jgi:hypothetical protein
MKLWDNTDSERQSDEEMSRDAHEKLWNVPDVNPKVKIIFISLKISLSSCVIRKLLSF